MGRRSQIVYRACALIVVLICTGCAGVRVSSVSTQDFIAQRRGDVLTTGRLSAAAHQALVVLGLQTRDCANDIDVCTQILMTRDGLDSERRMATLSEVWLMHALVLQRRPSTPANEEQLLNAYLQSARAAYAYLFFTPRSPTDRAFEDRQTQVRDYYNYSVQIAVTRLFEQYRGTPVQGAVTVETGDWRLDGRMSEVRMAYGQTLPYELIPASSLTFRGLRSMYRRDGFGAELVAVSARAVNDPVVSKASFSEMPFPAVTVIATFPGKTLDQVMQTRDAHMVGYDPYRRDAVELAGMTVPLAANFTSGYGLWLARSGFASQALSNVLGRARAIEAPHVYMLQPYDPSRRVIVMLHGLASSPEAWINVANEVLGDEALRQRYQIWQVFYPTNAPLAINNSAIRAALTETFAHFDPKNTAQSSRDAVIIGHSMGGVLSRLIVSSSGSVLLDALQQSRSLNEARITKIREEFGTTLSFEPFPGMTRAVFIAAPHQGTPFAENRVARWFSNLITLPAAVVQQFSTLNTMLDTDEATRPNDTFRITNGVDNLSENDPFVQLTAKMQISPMVRYHSIIANNTPNVPLIDSSDGLVPYRSAHLPGAESEKVINFSHSVQETPEAILEIRRILREHVKLSAP